MWRDRRGVGCVTEDKRYVFQVDVNKWGRETDQLGRPHEMGWLVEATRDHKLTDKGVDLSDECWGDDIDSAVIVEKWEEEDIGDKNALLSVRLDLTPV